MWRQTCLVWLLIASAAAIIVPLDNEKGNSTVTETEKKPDGPLYFEPDLEEPKIDTYLIPPNTHTADDKQDLIPTYLLPPNEEKQEDFYNMPANAETQSDWYPIQSHPPENSQPSLKVPENILPQPVIQTHPYILEQSIPKHHAKTLPQTASNLYYTAKQDIPIPSIYLEPPKETAENYFVLPTLSTDLELPHQGQIQQFAGQSEEAYDIPIMESNQNFNPALTRNTPVNFSFRPEPTLPSHLTPPKPRLSKPSKRVYPKKYPGGFRPVPIPLTQFAEESLGQVPKAKPVKPFNPATETDSEYSEPTTDIDSFLYEKNKKKQKPKKAKTAKPYPLSTVTEPHISPSSPVTEQETSETHYTYPGHNLYSAPLRQALPTPLRQAPPTPLRQAPPTPLRQAPPTPLRQAPPTALPRPVSNAAPSNPPPAGDRTEFRMHGMKGPHSYQFGYDTGKGKNRQFRFEERDNDGHVRGHYGYVDKFGKLRVVNYDADPQLGFRAQEPQTEP